MTEIFKYRVESKSKSLARAYWNLRQFFQKFCEFPQKELKEVKKIFSNATAIDCQTGQSLNEHKINGFIELGGVAKLKELLNQYISVEDKECIYDCLQLLSNNYFPFDKKLIVDELKILIF
ncbi:hypothetical protein RFI_34893 [Reticulomyxa filosa]|uniref:Uncharacterized protein n=1 Tax=Reticulomyxa filosa TaxID=46433 RepID=X6LP72_RETFI|nr:hypothetical protein RFI_34893 [Reticulomyxa filosa]|eukprot:ETO02535.1 hypothetical protein RFI_34893 [Reticulomyxa filosa]